ncbi:MAG: M16 family metallopeptidase [Dehalococcoidia bacterium]
MLPFRRYGLVIFLFVLLLAPGSFGRGALVRRVSAQSAAAGLQVTLSATAEDLDPAAGTPGGGMVLRVTLADQTGQDLSGVQLHAPLPPRTHATDSWLGRPGQGAGVVESGAIVWDGLALANGAVLGPFTYRIAPDDGVDGATIFLAAAVQPKITWTLTAPGSAMAPSLELNGLWGEGGLRRTLLPSGLTVFTRERPDTPTVALLAAARAGSRDETDTTCGGSHWLEHAHLLGTTTRPDNQAIGRAISVVGGQFNASTSWEATNFWDLVPADKFDVALDVLSDELLNSTFRPDAFEREKQVVLQEIKLRDDNPSTHATDQFLSLVFQTSPLHRSPAATACLLSLPIETILTYRAEHYVTGNMAIAAAGNLRHDDAVAKIARAFAGLPRGAESVRPRVPEPVETTPRRLESGTGTNVAEIRLGWPAPGREDRDWPAMLILQDILGSSGRRLVRAVNDPTASIGPSYSSFSDAGTLLIGATSRPDRVNSLIGEVLDQVQRLRDGDISQAEIDTSLRSFVGQRALSEESNFGQTQRATQAVSGTLESFDESIARLQTVLPQDVQRVAQKYLDPANYTLVIERQ